MVILMVPSGACDCRPLLDFVAIRRGIRCRRSNSAFPFQSLQAQTVSVQQSHGQFTVTPTGDRLALRGIGDRCEHENRQDAVRNPTKQSAIPAYRDCGTQWQKTTGSRCASRPRKQKSLLLFERLAMLCKMGPFIILLLASGCSSPVSRDFMCLFSHNPIAYRVDEKELGRSTTLITVTRDNRTFMFRRDSIKICQLAKVVQPEREQK